MELIKISEQAGKQTVNARDLHEFLEVQSKFADWVKNRIEKYGFVEDQDFVAVSKSLENGGATKEYYLSIDMAKELSMVENNDRGRQARRYFIEVEKQYKAKYTLPATFAEALRLAADQAEKIAIMAPKAEFYDAVTGSKDTIDIGEAAKVLAIPNLGRNKLFEMLRSNGVLMTNNQPYQTYVDKGYFRTVESKYNKPDGSTHVNIKTVVYQKGLEFMRKLAKKEGME